MSDRSLVVMIIVSALSCGPAHAREAGPIGPADYPEIARLLAEPIPEAVQTVRFEELWQDPTGGAGRALRVSGVSRRVFRQPAVGEFPALVELWITDASGNPIGLLFPDQPGVEWNGRQVSFRGRVLRMLDYRDGTGQRRAPLIVGPVPPNMSVEGPVEPEGVGRPEAEWVVGGMLLLFVVLVLGIQHSRRPKRRGGPPGPRPQFESPADSEPGAADG